MLRAESASGIRVFRARLVYSARVTIRTTTWG